MWKKGFGCQGTPASVAARRLIRSRGPLRRTELCVWKGESALVAVAALPSVPEKNVGMTGVAENVECARANTRRVLMVFACASQIAWPKSVVTMAVMETAARVLRGKTASTGFATVFLIVRGKSAVPMDVVAVAEAVRGGQAAVLKELALTLVRPWRGCRPSSGASLCPST